MEEERAFIVQLYQYFNIFLSSKFKAVAYFAIHFWSGIKEACWQILYARYITSGIFRIRNWFFLPYTHTHSTKLCCEFFAMMLLIVCVRYGFFLIDFTPNIRRIPNDSLRIKAQIKTSMRERTPFCKFVLGEMSTSTWKLARQAYQKKNKIICHLHRCEH